MIGFTGATLDRADHLRLDPQAIARLAGRSDARLLDFAGPGIGGDGKLRWLPIPSGLEQDALIFLGLEGDKPLFAPIVRPELKARSLFGIIETMQPADAALWGTARSLNEWHSRHGFCAACGSISLPSRAGWGRKCTGCGSDHFPRVDPVVIMLAEHEDQVLLGRQPQYPPGRYSALAGFVEPGESVEEAVARELKEEAGISISSVRYLASQPWPFPGQLMIACIAPAQDDRLTIDRTELEDAMWVSRQDVAAAIRREAGAPFLAPPSYAIAFSLLAAWLDG